MNEEEWKSKRNLAKNMLQTIVVELERVKNSTVLLGTEFDYCGIVEFQINNLLNYWDERSTVSRIRFVEGAKDV